MALAVVWARVLRLRVGEAGARAGGGSDDVVWRGRLAVALLSIASDGPSRGCPSCAAAGALPGRELRCGEWVFRDGHADPGTGEPPWHSRLVRPHEASLLFGSGFHVLWSLLAPKGAEASQGNFVLVLPEGLHAADLPACSLHAPPGPSGNSTAAQREPPGATALCSGCLRANSRLEPQELGLALRRLYAATSHRGMMVPDEPVSLDLQRAAEASRAAAQRISDLRLQRRGMAQTHGGGRGSSGALSLLQLGGGVRVQPRRGRTELGEASALEVRDCMAVGAGQRITSAVQVKMKTKFIIGVAAGVITTIALPLILAVLMPLIMIIVAPLLIPIIKLLVDLFEAILSPLLDAALSNDENSGLFKGAFFGPYKNGLWPYQWNKMRERADAVQLGPLKNSIMGDKPKSGGCSQLNALFYALFVFLIVQFLAEGIVKGLMKFLVKPLCILIRLLIPAEIGSFMIGEMTKLISRAIVSPATHGIVHAVNHALGHGLSRSVTVAVTHALTRAQTHYYYCLYCYYHGSYCQFCEFYNEYAQLGNKARDWGQYKPRASGGAGGEGTTEYARLSAEAKSKYSAIRPYEPGWSSEVACYAHFRPRGCQLPLGPPLGLPNIGMEINKPCTPAEYASDYRQEKLFARAGGFRDCRLSDMVEYFNQHTTLCVLPPGTPGLENGLRMRVRKLPSLQDAMTEAPGAEGMCDYDYKTMTLGADKVIGDEAADPKEAKRLRTRAFKKCREKVESIMVLAKYERFLSCVHELDSRR